MARWKTRDVARFEHDEKATSTIIGKITCLLCSWTKEPTSQYIFPTVDDAVQEHIGSVHPEVMNAAGVQRTPDGGALVYYVILNP
jgi:hypothetical protein